MTSTKRGKRFCPYCKGVPEPLIENAFVRSYNALCAYDGEFVDGFLERVKEGLQEADSGKELNAIDREIIHLKERKSGLVDMRLDDRIDEETYQMKIAEINSRLDKLTEKKESLAQEQEAQEDINKRLKEFQKVLSNHEILKSFDRHVFECIIDRVVVGETMENGEVDPYKLKFIYKTGLENEVAARQPFSFGNPYCNTSAEGGIVSPYPTTDTYRGGMLIVQTQNEAAFGESKGADVSKGERRDDYGSAAEI